MNNRKLGRTRLTVSEIGFGAWGIGKSWWGKTDDAESLRALRRAIELGISFFDTAYVYGDGHSERLIAKTFAESGLRGRMATKIPPKTFQWPGGSLRDCYPADWVISCTERSLKNLGVECVEVQQFHSWKDEWLKEPSIDETLKAVDTLKRQGKILSWGVSINDLAPASALELVKTGLVDTVQVIFNLFEQEPIEKLFPLCRERNIGVIARVPFDEGGLTGTLTENTVFEDRDFRKNYFAGGLLKETVRRAEILKKRLVGDGVPTLADAALKFILSFPEVSTVIPGMRTAGHVEANVKASPAKPYPKQTLDELRAHAWKRAL